MTIKMRLQGWVGGTTNIRLYNEVSPLAFLKKEFNIVGTQYLAMYIDEEQFLMSHDRDVLEAHMEGREVFILDRFLGAQPANPHASVAVVPSTLPRGQPTNPRASVGVVPSTLPRGQPANPRASVAVAGAAPPRRRRVDTLRDVTRQPHRRPRPSRMRGHAPRGPTWVRARLLLVVL